MISIIIPTYNEEKLIESTLRQFENKITVPYELIVADGGSTDRTVEIAKAYATKVVPVSGAEGAHPTIARGRNTGAQAATGDFFVFLDADCRVESPETFFPAALAQFEHNPKLVALSSAIKVLPSVARPADDFFCAIMNGVYYILNNVLRIGSASGEFQMIRATAFRAVNGFEEHLVAAEDAHMFYRLSKVGRAKMDPDLVVYDDGRHPHEIGWLRLLSLWAMNTIYVALFGKAYSKRWLVIR